MAEYYSLIRDNASERSALTERQDNDVLLRNLAAYVMKKADNITKVEGVINVTLNRPKVMANYILSALGKTTEQLFVETEEKNFDTDYIKDFRRLYFEAASANLLRQGLWELNSYLDEQLCIRGGAAAKSLCRMVEGALNPEITCWDFRYVNYEEGGKGLTWASYGYGTKRKKSIIEAQEWWRLLEKQGKRLPVIPGKAAEVVDVWDAEHNEVWLSGAKVFEQEHAYGFTPVVVRTVSLGSMIADMDDIENQAESIFFLIREAMPELNRLVSIIQTLALQALKPPAENARREGATAIPPPYDKVMSPGAISSADIGGGTRVINPGDANRAAMMAMERMDKNMEDGGFIPSSLGSPPASGLALLIEKEGKDVVYQPRLNAKSLMKQALGDMFTAQVLQIGGDIEVGTPGHKRTFQTKRLEGQYDVTHKFTTKSLSTDAGLASLAAAYGDSISQWTKNRLILQLEDPDGEERRLRWEESERLVPAIKFKRMAEDLIALGENDEAEMVAEFAGAQLEQMLSGGILPPKSQEAREPTQIASLFSGGAGGGRRLPPPPPVPVEEGS